MSDEVRGLPPELEQELLELAVLGDAARAARVRDLRERHPEHVVEIDVLAGLLGEGIVDDAASDTPSREIGPFRMVGRLGGGSSIVHLRSLPDERDGAGAPGVSAGKYELQDEIARGGIGVVLHGRDVDLGRGVAVKVLQDDYLGNESVVRRFVEEAQIGGQLQHPGIVPVYDIGTHDGRPFFAMKLIRGDTLKKLLDAHEGASTEQHRLLAIFEAVCQTMAYAHARGVVHRDLKPSNVMVGQFGEVQVVDWGMAKVLDRSSDVAPAPAPVASADVRTVRSDDDSDGSRSVDGQVMGTPTYMPPEQARGEVDAIDERSDVFALGAILCQILTGLPPYTSTGAASVVEAAKGDLAAARARIRGSGADDELQQLAIDCLQPEPSRRPRSAKEVADRVGAYRAGVQQRAEDARVQAAEAQVRARATLLLSSAVVLILLLVGGGWYYLENEAARRAEVANGLADDRLRDAVASLATARASDATRLDVWREAEALAVLAAEQAAGEDVEPTRRERARASLATVREEHRQARAEADRRAEQQRMLTRLEHVRIPADEEFSVDEWELWEARRLALDYAVIFADHVEGLDLREAPPDVAASALRGEIQVELAIALDLWAVAGEHAARTGEGLEPAQVANLRRIAAMLDADDDWRNELRRRVADGAASKAALVALAAEAPTKSLQASSTSLLVEVLVGAGARLEAVEVCRAGRRAHPGDFGLCMRHGILLAQQADWQGAASCFRIARALRPEMIEPLHLLGVALENGGQSRESLEIFRELLVEDPDDPHWLYHVGMAHLGLEQHSEAASAFDKGLRRDPTDGRMLLARAIAAEFVEGIDAAITRYRIAVTVSPSGSARWALGRALLAAGRADEALPALQAAVAEDPRSSAWLESLLEACLMTDQPRLAVEAASASHRLPGVATARSRCICGEALEQLGEFDAARREYEAALALGTDAALAHFGLARVLHREGQAAAELEHLRRAAQADPYHRLAVGALLRTLFSTGQEAEALARSRLLVTDPRTGRALLADIGAELNRRGHAADAEAAFRSVLQRGAPTGRDHYNLGNSLASQQRMHAAAVAYREALRLDPTHHNAANNLASCLCDAERLSAALAVVDEAVERHPESTRLLHTRIRILTSAGMLDEARATLEQLERVVAANEARDPRWRPAVDPAASRRLLERAPAGRDLTRQFVLGTRSEPGPEGVAFAARFANSLGLHARAVELFEHAFAADEPADPFEAGRAALLAAEHEHGHTEEQRAALRQQALDWLRAALSATTMRGAEVRAAWLEHGDLDSVRGERLAALPEAERSRWSAFWREFDERVGGR